MKEYKVIIDGVEKIMRVLPEEYDSFVLDFPDAELIGEEAVVEGPVNFQEDSVVSAEIESETPAQPLDSDSASENGSLELESSTKTFNIEGEEVTKEQFDAYSEAQKNKDKIEDNEFFFTPSGFVDFFGDIATAAKEGWSQGELIDPSFKLYDLEGDAKDEDIVDFINTNKEQARKNLGSAEMQEFNKIYEEEGGGIWGFIKGVAYNPSTLPTMLVSSMAGQISSLGNDKVQAIAAAGAAVGAAGGSFIPGVGTVAGGISGAMGGTMGAMETGLTFAELLQEEAGGLDKDAIRKVLNDPEKLADLKNKAAGRGLTIAAIEMATMGISKGVGGKLASAGFKMAPKVGAAATGAIEMIGGGTGEVAGRFVAGQEMDIAEIGFETFAGLGSAPVTLSQQALNLQENINKVKINKVIEASDYKNITDAFKNTSDLSSDIINLTDLKGSLGVIENKVKNEIKNNSITKEEGTAILQNFNEVGTANRQLEATGIRSDAKPEAIELLVERKNIEKNIKKINDPVLSVDQKVRVDELNKSIRDIIVKDKTQQSIEGTQKVLKDLGNEAVIIQVKDQVALNKEINKLGKEDKRSYKTTEASWGVIVSREGKPDAIILNEGMAFTDGVINTAAHEGLHFVLKNTLKSQLTAENQIKVGNSLNDFVKTLNINSDNKLLKARLDQYDVEYKKEIKRYTQLSEAAKNQDRTDLSDKALALAEQKLGVLREESITLLSEAMLNGDIKYNENLGTKLMDFGRRLISSMGYTAKFNTGKDVFNFIKDYNRSIEKNKGLSGGLKKSLKQGIKGKLIAPEVVNKATQEIETSKTKPELKESKTLNIEQLKEKAADLLEESNLDSSNQALLDRYYDTMDAIDAMEDAESNESAPIAKQEEKKQIAKDDTPQLPREKKDRSTKRYTLTDEQKAEIEPLIAKAQILNKELIAKEKAATDARIKKITDKSERQMSRTDQAKAIADIKANPTRYSKSAELTNLENKIQEKVKVPLAKLINAYTKRLYDGIPAQAKEIVSREDYQTEAKAVVITTLINEFKKNTTNRLGEKTTNDIEDLMFNRGYFRMLPLATAMGVSSKVEGIAQRFDNVANNIGTEDIMFDEKTNEPEMSMEGKFKISSFLPADAYDLALEQTKEFWEENVGNSPIENFKKLPSLVDDIMADIFGVSLNVFTARSGNLNATSYDNVLQAITKPYAVLKLTKNNKTEEIRVELDQVDAYESQLKDKGIEFERYADENILQTLFKFLPKLSADDYVYADGSKGRYRGKATGIPKNLVALTYENITRGTTGVGNRKANVGKQAYKDILNAIGGAMVDGKVIKRIGITGKSKEGQTLLGVLKLYNRMVTNEISRSPAVNLDPMTVKDIAAGKNDLMESKKIDLSGINKLNPEVDFEFSKWYTSKKKSPSSATQFKKLSAISYNILGDQGRKLFNAELAYNFDKLGADASLESIRNSIGTAWGKAYKWLIRDQGFNKAIEKLNGDSTKEDVRQFLQGFSRAWRNDKYQDISTNEQLVKAIEDQGVDFEGLGFKLQKKNKKGFVYEVKANGKLEFVNDPTTLLEIKNKSFDNIEAYGENSIKEVQTLQKVVLDIIDAAGSVDEAIAAIEAMSIGQMGTLRRISYLRNVYKSKGDKVLEHVTSLSKIKERLKDYARGKVSETEIKTFFETLYLDVIPAELENLLKKEGFEDRYNVRVKYKGKWTTVNKELKKLGKPAVFDVVKAIESNKESKRVENAIKAVSLANNLKTPVKGISVWDFDDTLAQTKSNVLYTMPNGTKGKLTAEEFAKTGDKLANEGAIYDFSEFSKVMNGKKGPMFEEAMARNEKFGNKNVYILTARPANSANAIHTFLKGLGLNIPVENITGLANSSPLAKADWVVEKAAEGYNDFYFADDHIGNVKAVQEVLNVLDVKGKVHQAKVKESKKLDSQFNKFLEGSTGIESFKRYKSDKAKLKGRYKGKFDAFIPPSAEDFLGLLYQTLNKGKQGDAQLKFYEDNLLKPYAKANSALRTARVRSIREFDAIKKKLKIVPKDLKRSFKFEDENGNMKDSLFTKEQAIRVYIWNSQGIEMPNLSQVDLAVMVNEVNANPDLKAFADELLKLNRGMDSKPPSKNWMDGNIGIDLQANLNSVGRKQLLEVWQQNVDEIFSEENLNKLEAAYGPEYVKALESSLRRMRTGRSTAPVTDNAAGNNLIMWLNSAVGNIMFFNNRSALLQMLSATNFLNFEDNNIIAAGKALMNIKQYSKDFVTLMNSDYLLDRRDGTRININEADIALIAKQSGITGIIAKILEAGFLPTKYADSLAIGIGGATFYRTKINALMKDGMSKAKAEAQAMQEFVSVAETSQQSSDQSKISMEQSGSVGKIILAFNNTSSQYSRIIKRSVQDLYNRRGSDKANLAKIVYYGGMQNLLFNFMQQAMFAAMWGGEDDEEVLDDKKAKIVNSMADGLLRGMGVKAAIFVAVKNAALKLLERNEKKRGQNLKYYAVTGMTALSPPLSSKASKLARAADAFQYGKDEMKYGKLSLDSPELTIGANLVSFVFSLPTDRLLTKAINVSDALDASNEPWERLFMIMGWPKWTMSTKAESDLERKEDKAKIKAAKEGEEFKKLTVSERKFSEVKDLKKAEQVDILINLGFSKKQIRLMKKEEDRINAIIKEQNKNKRKNSLK